MGTRGPPSCVVPGWGRAPLPTPSHAAPQTRGGSASLWGPDTPTPPQLSGDPQRDPRPCPLAVLGSDLRLPLLTLP